MTQRIFPEPVISLHRKSPRTGTDGLPLDFGPGVWGQPLRPSRVAIASHNIIATRLSLFGRWRYVPFPPRREELTSSDCQYQPADPENDVQARCQVGGFDADGAGRLSKRLQ